MSKQVEITGLNIRRIYARGLSPESPSDPASSESIELHKAFQSDSETREAADQVFRLLLRSEAKTFSGFSGCIFVVGFVLLLIPVIGWIIGGLAIVIGIAGLIAPQITFKYFDRSGYDRLKQSAVILTSNCYQSVSCPHCRTSWTKPNEGFCFLNDPEGIDCGFCGKRVLRKGDVLSKLQ